MSSLAGGGAQGQTYYVRGDGGSAEQCTGLTDVPYPGSGVHKPSAWDHAIRALPPGGVPRIAGGDTMSIFSADYQMGYGAPGAGYRDACGAFDTLPAGTGWLITPKASWAAHQ